jgi:hypothetical protein
LWRVTYPSGKNDGLIVMGDLPRKDDGLIMMGDLPRWRWWSHYDGWPTHKNDGLIMMGDLPRKHNGLIVMSDLPKEKVVVSLWWVTYPDEEWKVVSL